MTVAVDTPNGRKAGSSVIELTAQARPPLLTPSHAFVTIGGEATYVDLGNGKNVVALLSRQNDYDAAALFSFKAFQVNCVTSFCEWKQIGMLSGERDLAPKDFPTFVSFANPADANSGSVISGTDLSGVLGPGYSVDSVSIQLTNDPVTDSIKSDLPFLTSVGDRPFRAKGASDRSVTLTTRDFLRRP